METLKNIILAIFFLIVITSCEEGLFGGGNDSNGDNKANDTLDLSWAIPKDKVYDGGPGKDGIPAISSPKFTSVDEATYLEDNDLVIGIKVGNVTRAYPHDILDWHEIINDQIGTSYFSILYCPLTGTGIGWNRKINDKITTFGVSGLLYNTNLIPYDRLTNSNWSQIRLDCVQGELKGTEAQLIPVIETTWSTWKKMYPGSEVVSKSTGYSRSYGNYPYGSYRVNDLLIFPISNSDSRLHKKEVVHGVIENDKAKVYRFESFENDISLINDKIESDSLIVIGSKNLNLIVSFYKPDDDPYTISLVGDQVVIEDSQSNQWDIFGHLISGTKSDLEPTRSFMGFFFAWATFYDTRIYGE